jgi:RNA 2',3'-cyclic 3'-phosphodiesterase
MYRLFVGIALPEDIRARLGGLCAGLPGARWVDAEKLHLTLRFIGDVGRDEAEDIHDALARVRGVPFDLTVSGLGCFETGRKVRALWAGVVREQRLVWLQERVDTVLVRTGVEPEHRKFKAHVTLARFRNGGSARIGDYLEAHNTFTAGPFRVEAFTLFRSFLGREGAHYEALADYPLRAEAEVWTGSEVPD